MDPLVTSLLQRYPLISDQVSREDIQVILRALHHTLRQGIPGAIVELGCYVGTSSLFLRRLLDALGQSSAREFHVYDSFVGLPEKARQDQSAVGVDFAAGELSVSKKAFLQQFRAAHLQSPIIHKAWFRDLSDTDMPSPIAFAFLDGDFYDSILDSLTLVWPRMNPGGMVLVDDYNREALPGVERAVHDFFPGQRMPEIRVDHNLASFIR